MEDLCRESRFDGVLDWTTTEITDHIAGGLGTAGETRLDAP
jgi:uncharacterized protein (UPF0261 family)